ncbi:MAG: RrF2 family transcriptional regulator [Acetivibrionales bacterium]|jgi:Rrf2 family cysteine metabolism transcriptional repressor
MKISTKGRYGLRALFDLAISSGGEHISLNSIAQRQDVSESYLEHVFSTLRKAGIIKSVKGAQGGYMLSYSPSNITVGDILRVLEGSLNIVEVNPDEKTSSQSIEYCVAGSVWEKINDSIASVVDSITLEDLVNEYRRLNDYSSLMYYI